jgi:hypothetical protein
MENREVGVHLCPMSVNMRAAGNFRIKNRILATSIRHHGLSEDVPGRTASKDLRSSERVRFGDYYIQSSRTIIPDPIGRSKEHSLRRIP